MFQLTVRYCYAIANALTLVRTQKLWFDNVTTDSVEFYLATGYMNFTIANKIIISAKFWKEGLPNEYKDRDEHAKQILEKAFPGRKIVQIDCSHFTMMEEGYIVIRGINRKGKLGQTQTENKLKNIELMRPKNILKFCYFIYVGFMS